MNEQTTSSSEESEESEETEPENELATRLFGWVEAKYTSLVILIGLVFLSLVLMALDWEKGGGFYGYFGFAAFSFAVLSGWPLGSWLRRDTNYYDEEDEVAEEVES